MCKSVSETVQKIKKIRILRKKWAKFQTKAHKIYPGDLVTRTGEQEISVVFRRLPAIIRESWHNINLYSLKLFLCTFSQQLNSDWLFSITIWIFSDLIC